MNLSEYNSHTLLMCHYWTAPASDQNPGTMGFLFLTNIYWLLWMFIPFHTLIWYDRFWPIPTWLLTIPAIPEYCMWPFVPQPDLLWRTLGFLLKKKCTRAGFKELHLFSISLADSLPRLSVTNARVCGTSSATKNALRGTIQLTGASYQLSADIMSWMITTNTSHL